MDRNKDCHWVLRKRVQDSGTEIQGRRAFSRIELACVSRMYKGGVKLRRGILLVGHGGLK